MIAVFYFFIFYILSIATENSPFKQKKVMLAISLIAMTLFATYRDIYVWPDSVGYSFCYSTFTPNYSEYLSFGADNYPFPEKGFLALSILCKSISNDYLFFFFIVAALSYFLIYKGIIKYSLFPMFAFALYLSRFGFGRHFIQIRAGLAIAIVFWGLQYAAKREFWKYMITVFVAWLFHRSAIIAVPFYFLNYLHLKKKHIYWSILGAYIITLTLTPTIRMFVSDTAQDIQIGTSYTQLDNKGKSFGLGLLNPMLYYQTIILILFTYFEEKLKPFSKYYETLRNGYLYSTLWLITLSSFAVLSARGSTIFATYEILIIPYLTLIATRKNRILAYIVVGLFSTAWFYVNYKGSI